MKVLLLGAGASKPAGYPLASELMTTIERDARESRNADLRRAWELWEETRRAAPGPLRLLLEDPNPEVALSVLDLCSISYHGSFPAAFRDDCRDEIVSSSLSDNRMPGQFFLSRDHEWLYNASTVRLRLLESLMAFFEWKHYQDSNASKSRDYLRAVLAGLQLGDVIMTLNWDTIAERTLFELGQWSPSDGYGFDKELQAGTPIVEPKPLPPQLSKPSGVVVLKLHGSLGWYDKGEAQPYFDSDFLSFFNLTSPNGSDIIHDPREPEFGPPHKALISYPSFLKKFEAPIMQTIWERADRALRETNDFEVWGYSLPSSDSAIRVLLNSLRRRPDGRTVDSLVHVPDPPRQSQETDSEYEPKRQAAALTRERWKQLLGMNVKIDKRALG